MADRATAGEIADRPRLELYWIPLGAGAQVVRLSGRAYEALTAVLQQRPRRDLYHSALIATTAAGRTIVESAPVPDGEGPHRRGVVAEGAVGSSWLGRLRVFRYEVRRWPGGLIPDLRYAVASPVRLTEDPLAVAQVLELVAEAPSPVWGRDELHAGEMWNSNSLIAWVLARAGLLVPAGQPPPNGRAPGWDAGIHVAGRLVAPPATRTTVSAVL